MYIDTGSVDTALPTSQLNNYVGNTVNLTTNRSQELVSVYYADNSYWRGYQDNDIIGLQGTNISSYAPFAGMVTQSTDPVFVDGIGINDNNPSTTRSHGTSL